MGKNKQKPPGIPDNWVDTPTLAAKLGVGQATVRRSAKSGRIQKDSWQEIYGNYWYNLDKAVDDFWANSDPSKLNGIKDPIKREEHARRHRKAANARGLGSGDVSLNVEGGEIGSKERYAHLSSLSQTELKRRETATKVLKAETELRRLQDSLIDVDTAYNVLFTFGSEVRKAIEQVPERVVDDLLASQDRVAAVVILKDALDEALRTLDNKPKLQNRG